MSERETEVFTLQMLGLSLDKEENDNCFVYAQGDCSKINDEIKKVLKEAGGKPDNCNIDEFDKGGKGSANPEFMILPKNKSNLLIVVECKEDTSRHSSKCNYSKPKDYAIDGALYYAKFLRRKYDVIALAVSGNSKNYKTNAFLLRKGFQPTDLIELTTLSNKKIRFDDLITAFDEKNFEFKNTDYVNTKDLAIQMHEAMRNVGIVNSQRALFIADMLIALEDNDFRNNYNNFESIDTLNENMSIAIGNVLRGKKDIEKGKIDNIKNTLNDILQTDALKKTHLDKDGSIKWFINELAKNIFPLMKQNTSIDTLGIFFHEFISFGGGDGNGLGIVLTPEHITDFMARLIQIDKNDKVVDICCGSAGFLVTAMSHMLKDTTKAEQDEIKKNNLFGIEYQENLHTLAMANMIIRRDGHSQIFKGDCFDSKFTEEKNPCCLKHKGINKCLINPPYSQKKKKNGKKQSGNNHSELEFVERALEILVKDGLLACIVPMSCAIGTKYKDERDRLFRNHTLLAVFSMPDDVFYPSGVNTCIMIWKAHTSHKKNIETFFGYYKNDGFEKKKKLGRVDTGTWSKIEKEWLAGYRNKEIKDGFSALKAVDVMDEWLCEAYMKTDFSKLQQSDFEKTIRKFLAYKVETGSLGDDEQ